jgi:hypothetical protein
MARGRAERELSRLARPFSASRRLDVASRTECGKEVGVLTRQEPRSCLEHGNVRLRNLVITVEPGKRSAG